jgi:type II secretory pathway pseudopilin PulG
MKTPLRTLRLCGELSAFTLLEVLVAMTIMIMVVLMVTNMFHDVADSWTSGTQSAEMNTSARAAMEYISRELSCAVATLKPFKLENGNELSFVAFPGTEGALCGVHFKFENRTIVTTNETTGTGFQPYAPPWSPSWAPGLLITNVWRFQAGAYLNESDITAGIVSSNYDSTSNFYLLPACVDLYLEVLNERDMARAQSMGPGPSQDGFVMTNSHFYTTRVYLQNRGRSQ